MSWESLKHVYNFTNLGLGNAISQNANGQYEIQYLLPETTGDLEAIDYKSILNYYTDVPDNRATSFSKLSKEQAGAVRMILGNESEYNLYSNLYNDVSNIIFLESATTNAGIVWGQNPGTADLFEDNPDGAIAVTTLVNPASMPTTATDFAWGRHGDIWLNANFSSWADAEVKGTIEYWAIMHEPGHSLGLKDAKDVFSGTDEDSQQYTIMSYRPLGWVDEETPTLNALYSAADKPLYAYGLQLYDIKAIQSIYGENHSVRDGNATVYDFGSGLGRGSSKDNAFIYTIWDGAGTADTIDVSGFTGYNAKISLVEGTFSSIGSNGMGEQGYNLSHSVNGVVRDINNVAIAYGTLIENAIGGDGNDHITGNTAANTISGGAGDDIINGGAGNDTLNGGDDNDIITGGSGNDFLSGGAGRDVYIWSDAHGSDTIADDWLDGDRLVLSETLTSSVHVFIGDGPDLYVSVDGWAGSGGVLTIKGMAEYASSFIEEYVVTLDKAPANNPISALSNVFAEKPQYIDDAAAQFLTAEQYHCPLVLDLGVGGITLTSSSASPVYWDIDNDGFREASGWVGPEDGLLAVDLNSDGIINNHAELFGTDTQNGFSILAQYDSNADSAITSSDTNFGKLLVWVDANSNGYTDAGELHTLTELGITSISLATTAVSYSIAGNPITAQATFTQSGVSHQIVSADFAFDNVNTTYDQNYTLDARTLFLPDLRGYGRIADLHVAMSNNEELLVKVAAIGGASLENTFDAVFDVEGKINDILYIWAGVDDLSATGRGGQTVDDRELEFMEELFDNEYLQADQIGLATVPLGAIEIDHAYVDLFNAFAARLYAQSELGKLLADNVYDPLTDTFSGFTGLDLDVLDAIKAIADTATDPLHVWQQVLRLIEGAVGLGNLSGGDATALEDAITDTYTGHTIADILASIQYAEPTLYEGTSGADTDAGTTGSDQLFGYDGNDNLSGNSGIDQINGGEGNDTLTGGTGNDALFGGEGNDTYVYTLGDGRDNLDEVSDMTGALDTIILSGGILQSNVTLTRVDGNNLQIEIAGGGGIYIFDQFANGKSVERLVFSDGSSIDLAALEVTTTGTSGANTMTGADRSIFPHDYLVGLAGNDTLAGGLGNDILDGGDGNDLYQITAGQDIVRENAGTDTIAFNSSYNKAQISYKIVNGVDLQILFNGVPAVLIEKQFLASGYSIETLQFSDSSTISLSSLSFTQDGTAAGDRLYGLEAGSSTNDVLNGLRGNDTLSGGAGNDTLDGGFGNDRLNGDAGNDIFKLGAGTDTVRDSDGSDTITFSAGYSDDDMSFKRVGNYDLEIDFNGMSVGKIEDYFLGSTYAIETLKFSDNSTFDLTAYHDVMGTSGNDTLAGLDNALMTADGVYGLAGNDAISGGTGNDLLFGGDGDDNLAGGAGDDLLDGGAGNDTLTISAGHDTVTDTAGTDKIVFGAGYDVADLTLVRTGADDLSIRFDGVEAVLVKNQFADTGAIESLLFNDSSTVNLTTASYTSEGTSGEDTLYGIDTGGGGDIMNGNDGTDVLYGFGGNDTLSGGNGDDQMYGGTGDDNYVVTAGTDIIIDGAGNDTVTFGSGYDLADMTLIRSSQYGLEIRFDDIPVLYLDNQFGPDGAIETLKFADNSTVTLTSTQYSQIGGSGADTLYGISYGGVINDIISGYGGDDQIYGYDGNDTLSGGDGNDTVDGGAGNDLFQYTGGVDLIVDGGGTDTISFASGFTQANMTIEKVNSSDLKISFSGTEALTIHEQFGTNGGIETLSFSGGGTYNLASFRNTVNGTSGAETINGSSSTTVVDAIYGNNGNDAINALEGDDYLFGGANNDTLNGGDGNDVLDGGANNDYLYGDAGDDTYMFSAGNDTISDTSGSNILQFGAGITFADLTLYRQPGSGTVPENLYISQGGNLTVVQGQFSIYSQALEKLVFADGSEVLVSTLNLTMNGTSGNDTLDGVAVGTGLNDTLVGNNGIDTINAGAGNDRLDGGAGNDSMMGGDGDDTYIFAPGFASASGSNMDRVVENTSEGTDKIVFTGGILPEDIRAWVDTSGYLFILRNSATTSKMEVAGYNAGSGTDVGSRVEQITFDNGVIWDLTQGLTLTDTNDAHSTIGSAQADFIDGRSGNDTIDGYGGNDTLIGGVGTDDLTGGTGDDSYVFSTGFGVANNPDILHENADEGTDSIIWHGVTPGNIRLWIDTSGYVYARDVNNANDTIMLYAYASDGSDVGTRFETLVFDDGTVWDLSHGIVSTGLDTNQSMIGTSSNDIIDGRAGNDDISGYGGDDILTGGTGTDTMTGGTGDDTYIFAPNFGTSPNADLIVENTNEGIDTIRITGTLVPDDIRSWSDGYYYYINFAARSADLVKIAISNEVGGINLSSRIEHIVFDNGTDWDLSTGLYMNDTSAAHQIYASAQGDTIFGNAGNDTVNAVDGNDSVHGGDGNDVLYGESGADLIYGDAGTDTLYGGDGADTLYGGASADLLDGGDGADTYEFTSDTAFSAVDNINGFDTSGGDALDLSSLLIGYDPLQNSINSFITLSGTSHTTVTVDRDGAGTTYTGQSVATLLNVTGLSVTDMLTNGNLIVSDS